MWLTVLAGRVGIGALSTRRAVVDRPSTPIPAGDRPSCSCVPPALDGPLVCDDGGPGGVAERSGSRPARAGPVPGRPRRALPPLGVPGGALSAPRR